MSVKIEVTGVPHTRPFSTLAPGDLFRYAYPADVHNVYMKLRDATTDTSPKAILLNTGIVYDISGTKEVSPLKKGQVVAIEVV